MIEEFRDVVGYEGLYLVSESGHVFNRRSGRILRQIPVGNGYVKVALFRDRTRFNALVHRLVASAFVPNPDNKPQVNHINGIKTDNRADNLEWCTQSENLMHRHRVLCQPGPRCRPVQCVETGAVYPSAKDAAQALGLNRIGVTQVCNGKQKTTKKLHFRFMED